MKVSVITRHAVSNYGSLLQAIATQKVIEEMGFSCEIIDYIRKDERYDKIEKTLLQKKTKWNSNWVKRNLYLLLRQPEGIAAGLRFERARKKYLQLSKRYTSLSELKKEKPVADIYLTGSDQVWGPVGAGEFDEAYCLAFTEEKDVRIAYAASFGYSSLDAASKAFYQPWLRRYADITVREESGVALLHQLEMDARQVLDPTLLVSADDWSQMASEQKGKYVLVYQIHNNPKLNEYAKNVAKKKKLPLIRVSPCFHQIIRAGRFVWLPDLHGFLGYIKHADCFITDSFHGTAFAVNFNVPFVEVLTNNGTESRNISFLRTMGLDNRVLQDENDFALADCPINYAHVNAILQQKRKESKDILRYMLEKKTK